MKLINKLLYIAALLILASCSDDPIGTPSDGIYPEGETIVRASLDFEPFAASEVASRAQEGKIMDRLDELCLLAYDTDGNLVEGFPIRITEEDHNLDITDEERVDADASYNKTDESYNKTAESKTKHATFKLKLPYGKYYIYGVANLGKMEPDGITRQSTLDVLNGEMAEVIKKRTDFLNYRHKWDTANMLNNCEMLGYFTIKGSEKKSPYTCGDMNEKTVSITKPYMEIHSWLRRCASKITIDFDGSGLLPGATVYFRRATIHDIPDACALGKLNVVNNENGLTLITNKNNDKYGQLHPEGEAAGCDKLHPEDNGDNYRPVEGLSSDYAITYGEGTEFKAWPNVTNKNPRIMEGTNPKDFHHENAEALFLYENMQGNNPDDDGKTQKPATDGSVAGADTDMKDGMPYGSYIEVEGYYNYTSTSHVTEGKIIYRFMLGKDAEKNFDVERNYHYKITLCPRGYGNDVDWHIEYLERSGFEFNDPYYVSYLYNHDSTLRFRYTPPEGTTVDSLVAEIVGNNWWPEDKNASFYKASADAQNPLSAEDREDPLNGKFDQNKYQKGESPNDVLLGRTKYLGNGFLSLRATEERDILIKQTLNSNEYTTDPKSHDNAYINKNNGLNRHMNDRYFYGISTDTYTNGKDRSRRTYYFKKEDADKDTTKTGREDYTVEELYDGSMRFKLPVFTRAKNLVKESAYTGNNPFESSSRMAYVKVTVHLSNKKTESQILRVEQVPRITNPKGIYRSAGKNENFHVVLTEKDSDNGQSFSAVESDGPWMAEVIEGDRNFINLNGKSTIKGASGTEVQFSVRFNKMNRDDKVRNAIVRVRYHNYSCVHLIFVRQGYDAQEISSGTRAWHTRNLIADGVEGDDPRDEGSLFRYGNLTDPIDAINNIYDTPGTAPAKWKFQSDPGELLIAKADKTYTPKGEGKTWDEIVGDLGGFPAGKGIAEMKDFEALYRTDNVQHGFGVLYADGATGTQMNVADATGWCRHLAKNDKGEYTETEADRDKRGMYGVFVYYWDNSTNSTYNCRNIFFPIGRSGYGHRAHWSGGNSHGVLRYACGRNDYYNADGRNIIEWLPLFYDLFQRNGAIYWACKVSSVHPAIGNFTQAGIGLDMNFFTFDVNLITSSNVIKNGQFNGGNDDIKNADACFIRCIGN